MHTDNPKQAKKGKRSVVKDAATSAAAVPTTGTAPANPDAEPSTLTSADTKDKAPKKGKKNKHQRSVVAASVPASAAPAVARESLSAKAYAKELKALHIELVKLQEWVKHKGLRVCILFEGRDGAGKGGTIKALTERVSPRVFRVVALPAPTDREKSQIYLQRYVGHLPAAGEVVIFDRSWYNRAGVERVMGFATEAEVEKFLKAVPLVEKAIVDSGVILLKYWLEVSPDEQTRRIAGRIDDGRKIWKLSPMDVESYSRWYDYSRARDAMFEATDSSWAPWYAVRSDDKGSTRLNILSHILEQIPYKEIPSEKVVLPKRQKRGDYVETKYPFRFIPEKY